jgi:hypothetical protein
MGGVVLGSVSLYGLEMGSPKSDSWLERLSSN